jgi:hypothetical protein
MSKEGFLKARNSSKKVIYLFVLVAALLYALTSLRIFDLGGYFAPVFGLTLGILVFTEVGVNHYFNKSAWKNVNGQDIANFLAMLVAGAAIVNSIFMMPAVSGDFTIRVRELFGTAGGVIAGLVAVMASVLLLTKDKP